MHARGVGEELDVWDGEGEAGVAGVADVSGCCARDGEEGVGGWGGAVGACWEEGAGWRLVAGWESNRRGREVPGEEVGCRAADGVDETCAGRVLVDEFLAEADGERGGAFLAAAGFFEVVFEPGNFVEGLAAAAFDGEVENGDLKQFDAMQLDGWKGQRGSPFSRLGGQTRNVGMACVDGDTAVLIILIVRIRVVRVRVVGVVAITPFRRAGNDMDVPFPGVQSRRVLGLLGFLIHALRRLEDCQNLDRRLRGFLRQGM